MAEMLFCYGCARLHPVGTKGEIIKDTKGNSRWCYNKCAGAKRETARAKKSPPRFTENTAK